MGSEGLFFFPYLTGAGAPHWEPGHLGSLLGLRLSHSRGHIWRALMEGVGYEVRWIAEQLRELGIRVDLLKAVGGGARSSAWMRIVADITGITMSIPDVIEAGAVGAAIIAGMGCGLIPPSSIAELVRAREVLQPDQEAFREYSTLFRSYKDAFEGLSAIYSRWGSQHDKG